MSDIQDLIELLKSDNPIKRYDACEELRVSPSLLPEAIEALRLVTNDANPDVADAAHRALALHTPHLIPEEVVIEQERDKTIKKPVKNRFLIGLLMGVFLVLVFCLLDRTFLNIALCISPIAIMGGIFGAYIGNDKVYSWIVAFVLAFLGVVIFLAFLSMIPLN